MPSNSTSAKITNTELSLIAFITILPFSYMTYKGLFSLTIISLLLISIIVIVRDVTSVKSFYKLNDATLITVAMFTSAVSVGIGQFISQNFQLQAFDGPSRLILSLPILIAIFHKKINFGNIFSKVTPAAILCIGVYAHFNYGNYGDRMSVNYLDPIIWGNYCLILGFISLYSIEEHNTKIIKLYKLIGLLIGLYLSIHSQSRAGWLAGIFLYITWLILNRKTINPKKLIIYLLIAIATILYFYFNIDFFKTRIDTAFFEFLGWQNKTHIESSTGFRLTMWKMGLYLFSQKPLMGYGDHGLSNFLQDPYILSFADAESIYTIQCCGPHNEILAHMLRSGSFGILAIFCTYLLPIYLFMKWENIKPSQANRMGIALCMGTFICSFFSEMLSLKINYSFYGILLAGLLATSLWQSSKINHE